MGEVQENMSLNKRVMISNFNSVVSLAKEINHSPPSPQHQWSFSTPAYCSSALRNSWEPKHLSRSAISIRFLHINSHTAIILTFHPRTLLSIYILKKGLFSVIVAIDAYMHSSKVLPVERLTMKVSPLTSWRNPLTSKVDFPAPNHVTQTTETQIRQSACDNQYLLNVLKITKMVTCRPGIFLMAQASSLRWRTVLSSAAATGVNHNSEGTQLP